MVITKIEYQKRDPERVNIYIDGKFFCGISIDTLALENLYEGLEVDDNLLDKILKEDLGKRFLNRAADYLFHAAKTEFQVRQYLKNLKFKKKGIWFNENIQLDWDSLFNQIIDSLKKYKYIDDEEFAHSFVQSRLRVKPRGKSVLISELLSKGVNKEIAQRVCDEEITDELEVLENSFRKKFKNEKFNIQNQKMVGYLLRKGFSWDLIEQFERNESEKYK
ncbi:MAG TPA: RecX family transcriptional regulator [Candidatus Dojkabacteria bacterium]|mgnify:FL=1|nr:RecX family transcriptional regulator [Candidatus Dojkabacteria bacterium]